MKRFVLLLLFLAVPTAAQEPLRPGKYAVSVEITLPNIDTRDYGFETEICWRGLKEPEMPLGPLGPGPLRECSSVASVVDGGFRVLTTCEGPNAGWAKSVYRVTATGFRGRVDMNMGGKNMRVGEIQRGRWVGPCD